MPPNTRPFLDMAKGILSIPEPKIVLARLVHDENHVAARRPSLSGLITLCQTQENVRRKGENHR